MGSLNRFVDAALRGRARVGTIRYPIRLLASATGYAITAVIAWYLVFNYPGWAGRDVDVWIRAGEDVRAGVSPYAPGHWASEFFFAPPWALFFGTTSWVGKPVLWVAITLAEIAALRYIAGSWLRVGYFGLCFVTGAEIVSGAFNLVIAAALAAAIRGSSGPAAFMALAKISPVLAIRDWRTAAAVWSAAALITLPFLGWWLDWISFLVRGWSAHPADGFHGSFAIRLVIAASVLVLWRSRRGGAAAAAIAIPIFYPISIVLFFALFTPARKSAQPEVEPSSRPVAPRAWFAAQIRKHQRPKLPIET